MSKPFGQPVRGEYDATPGAGVSVPITFIDVDGGVRTLAADERLDITDVSYRCTAASNIRVFFDTFGDGSTGQQAGPTLAHAPASTGIPAGTYTISYAYYDPFTKSETPRSVVAPVTVATGDNITVTAPFPVPAYMTDRAGNRGYINVYRNDGVNTGFLGSSAPGTNSLILTSVTNTAQLPPMSGSTGSGKVVGGALLPANGCWSDCFETGKIGPPGISLFVNSSVSTPIIIHVSGRIIKNAQLP